MRYTGETTEFPVRRIGEDSLSVIPKTSKTPDCEDWIWMVDEDPAFYLSEATGV